MALVASNRQQLQRVAAGSGLLTVADMLARPEVRELVRTASREIAQSVRSTAQQVAQSTRRARKRSKSKASSTKQDNTRGALTVGPSYPIVKTSRRSLPIYGTALTGINTDATGNAGNGTRLAAGSTSSTGTWSLGDYAPRLGAMAGLYRHFKLLSLRVTFVPTVADTIGGVLVLAIDASSVGTVPAFTSLVGNEVTTLMSIRKGGSIEWKPYSAKDKEEKFTSVTAAGNIADASYGTLYWASSGCPASTNIGWLRMEYSVIFDEEVNN